MGCRVSVRGIKASDGPRREHGDARRRRRQHGDRGTDAEPSEEEARSEAQQERRRGEPGPSHEARAEECVKRDLEKRPPSRAT